MESTATTEVKKPSSLFASAKVIEKKTDSKDQKVTVILPEAQYPNAGSKLQRLTEIRERIADMEAEGKMIEGVLKEIGKEKFAELYAKGKSNPGSFILKGETEGAMMCIVMDKYLTIDGGRAEELKTNFGNDTVSCVTEYAFNPELLEKYEEVLSELISNCPEIKEEDKGELIQAKQKFSVKKGMINQIVSIAGADAGKIGAVVSALQPVVQLKNSRG